ncbi:hypothetical protein GPECTOR_14g236 [Gonium pectorale]|uniref:Uncharacterized protein n=1 Tax=Gonium pectorale TaxID=33097 RepID=A0A150GMK9_GONPE|nr:hypothetical protein GPECTOR_14g236 [Gonium pectorale]|eukprot:KXZ50995.1 hypothetical protein GPECTOR_14g236 [Gonium pectorale]
MLYDDTCSDYIWRFRIAVTPKNEFVYAFKGRNSSLIAFGYPRTGRGILSATWATDVIPLANVTQPTLNVDTSTDRVYFVHPVDGKIRAYDASTNLKTPVWVSDIVCTDPADPRVQARQTFAANGTRLLARCNDSVVVLDENGRTVKTFSGDHIKAWVTYADQAAPFAMYGNFTKFVTWAAVPSDGVSALPNKLFLWDLSVRAATVTRPLAVLPLPDGASPAGVTSDSPWLLAVADISNPVLHLASSVNGKIQSSFDFMPLVNANGSLINVTIVPTPVIANRTVYGMVQAVLPSPFPWVPGYPDKFFWWMFALNITNAKQPSVLWITDEIVTRGPLANQVPLVRGAGVFMTDYMQNATRSFFIPNGTEYYNVPANPYVLSTTTTYSILRGTYKMGLPWVSPDGKFLRIQYDDWQYDLATPAKQATMSMGSIRTFQGIPNPFGSGPTPSGSGGFGRRR